MSTTVIYKGNTLTTINNATKTLKTAGKYMEDDVILTNIDSGGGDGYILTTVCPQQTITPNSDRIAYPVGSFDYEVGEFYLVTFDGVEYVTSCALCWETNHVIGDTRVIWNDAVTVVPFCAITTSVTDKEVYCRDTNTHTIKVEHLELVSPTVLTTKSITTNGTYAASSDNADGYSSVTVNVAGGGTASGGNDFVVTLSYNEQTEMWEPDCTYAEAAAAASAGKSIVVDADVPSVDATADGEWNDFLQHLEYWVHQYYDSANGGIVETQYRLRANGLIVQGTTTYVVEPTGSMTITQNGTGIDVAQYASVDVAVPTGGTYQAKTNISPTTSSQTITPDSGYDALSSVQINAMPSGTAGTPTATKGTVSNHSITVTPSVTNTTGYITGSTKTGTAVTVSASELVSGSETKTANGTYNVTNLASLVVNIPIVTYHTSSSVPTSSQGSNGDLWLVTA